MEQHSSEPADFDVKVIKSFKDPLSRQITELVMIKNHTGELLNSKSEFYQPPIVKIKIIQLLTRAEAETLSCYFMLVVYMAEVRREDNGTTTTYTGLTGGSFKGRWQGFRHEKYKNSVCTSGI